MSYQVRLATETDAPLVRSLIAEYLPGVDPQKRYEWIYRQNPHGPASTWLTFDEATKKPVGMTSFFRRRLIVNGGVQAGALGGDGYVQPRFRRRGIAAAMHRASRDAMDALGLGVMYGAPMPANKTPLSTVDGRDVTESVRFVRPLSGRSLLIPESLQPLFRKMTTREPDHVRLVPMTRGDKRADVIWERSSPELRVAVVRDSEFYTWRFVDSPSQKQVAHVIVDRDEPIGMCALEALGKTLRVIDFLAPKATWNLALAAVVAQARAFDSVEFKLTREDGRRHGLVSQLFFPREKKPLNIVLPPSASTSSVFLDRRAWMFTWADADHDSA